MTLTQPPRRYSPGQAGASAGLLAGAYGLRRVGKLLSQARKNDKNFARFDQAAAARIQKAAESLYPQTKGILIAPSLDRTELSTKWAKGGERFVKAKIAAQFGKSLRDVTFVERPEILGHELGHAVHHAKRNRSWRAFHSVQRVKKLTNRKALLAGAAAAGGIALSQTTLSDRVKKALLTGAILAPLAIAAPMLVDEALASIRGMKILRQALKQNQGKLTLLPGTLPFTAKDLSRKPLLQAFGSYVTAATAPALAIGGGALGGHLWGQGGSVNTQKGRYANR